MREDGEMDTIKEKFLSYEFPSTLTINCNERDKSHYIYIVSSRTFSIKSCSTHAMKYFNPLSAVAKSGDVMLKKIYR